MAEEKKGLKNPIRNYIDKKKREKDFRKLNFEK